MKRLNCLCAILALLSLLLVAAHWPVAPEEIYAALPPHSMPEERHGLIAQFEGELALLEANKPPLVWMATPDWIGRLPRPLDWWAMRITQPAYVASIKRRRNYEDTLAALTEGLRVKLGDVEFCEYGVRIRNAAIDLRVGKKASMFSDMAARQNPDWDQDACNRFGMERAKEWADTSKRRPLKESPYLP